MINKPTISHFFYKKLGPILFFMLWMGCANDPKTTATPVIASPDSIHIGDSEVEIKRIRKDGLDIALTSKKDRLMSELQVDIKDSTQLKQYTAKLQLDGQIQDVHVTDLNNDGLKEVYIFNTSSGSGSYGDVIGYQLGKSGLDTILFSSADANADENYMGHDSFYIKYPYLYRKYPKYREIDPNCCPTGGTRNIAYKLIKQRGRLILKQTKL